MEKTIRSAPPPLRAASQSKPSLSDTKTPSVVDSAMKNSSDKRRIMNNNNAIKLSSSSSSPSNNNNNSTTGSSTNSGGACSGLTLIYGLGFSVIISALVNVIHFHSMPDDAIGMTALSLSLIDFKEGFDNTKRKVFDNVKNYYTAEEIGTDDQERINNEPELRVPHYDQLHCEAFGGPSPDIAQEMVYWQDIPSDTMYVSPFKKAISAASTNNNNGRKKKMYMTFEPDGGGWNNIRMSMETILGLAVATGRTLVLPPEQRMYLLAKNRGTMKTDFSFMDFFPMKELANENAALHMISMEEFLITEAMTGNLRDKYTGQISFPPENRTNWNGQDVKILKEWLRNVTFTPLWDPDTCFGAFPATGKHQDSLALSDMFDKIIKEDMMMKDKYLEEPLPLDATPIERMREITGRRTEMCLYDEQMQNESVIHFMCYHKMRVRMLVHFYIFLYFENWQDDLWMKRFMRDHVRYVDEIQCAAGRIVHAMREYSRNKDPVNNPNGLFDTFHIRRGDFQYKKTRIDAEEIYNNVKHILPSNSTIPVYIATDERDKKFFEPLKKHYDIKLMDDFMPLLENVNHNYFGMIDQLIASRGRLFFGCWFSTFTGFITRLRGYYSVRDKLPGHEKGLLPDTYYYVTTENQYAMHKYVPIQPGFFNREFPTSWRGIDFGIDKLPNRVDDKVTATD